MLSRSASHSGFEATIDIINQSSYATDLSVAAVTDTFKPITRRSRMSDTYHRRRWATHTIIDDSPPGQATWVDLASDCIASE
jgi:hypothetical protein